MFKITDVKIIKMKENNSKLLGVAKVVIDNSFTIRNIRIIQDKPERGLYISFPSKKNKNGIYKNMCHPINTETRKYFEQEILASFMVGDQNENNN